MAANKDHLQAHRITALLSSQEGSFAVIFALCLMTAISLFAFVLDAGFLIREDSSFQDCADQAAISAAQNFCHGNPLEAAETVAYASHPGLPAGAVTVELGYYDAFREYDNFPTYTNFISWEDEGFPDGEACNAVMVSIEAPVKSMTGFNEAKTVAAAAVAYVPRVSVFSGGNATFGKKEAHYPVIVNNGNIYAKGSINIYGPLGPNVKLASENIIKLYQNPTAIGPYSLYFSWIEETSDDLPEEQAIEKFYLPDPEGTLEAYIEKMKAVADVVYTVDDAGRDHFYGLEVDGLTKLCFFDLTRAHEDHEIIFFDAGAEHAMVFITPHACLNRSSGNGKEWLASSDQCIQQIGATEAAGSEVMNLTFVANCSIKIESNHADRDSIPIGGENFDQVHFISSGSITYHPGNNPLKGVTIYAPGFENERNAVLGEYPDQDRGWYLTIVATTGSIDLRTFTKTQTNYNFKFAPPCPPLAPPTLGRLEMSTSSAED